jgi:two-component system, chemotaxis family, CheB/CheR fusion protein
MANEDSLEPDLRELIRYIQDSRGIDFRGYKKTSLRRRLSHRMEKVGAETFAAYHAFLEAHPQEFSDLLDTVLINVTSFFRDAEAWDVLRTTIIPRLAEHRLNGAEEQIRIWSVGCATGEEPYSLAMLFAEVMGTEAFANRVKIYATDLDEAALHVARHAAYAPRDVEGVPAELLTRYFERTKNHYVFTRELRKSVIFGRHNVACDAPISRADMVVCRNLLIYLETETQDLVLPRLHFALRDDGYLFLGKAETQLARSKLFEPVDLKHRVFRKLSHGWRRHVAAGGGGLFVSGGPQNGRLAPLHTRLLEGIADTSGAAYLALDPEGVLVFANFMAKRLLDVAEADIGRPFQDLAVSYRPAELRGRIEKSQRTGRTVRLEHQEHLRPPADPIRLTIEVTPLLGGDGRGFATLLSFADTTRAYLLQQELRATQESLETHVEELQSSNEELETTNEELQSTNEELETTNEELQSTNEELETMNEELRSTNEELEAANEELRERSEETAEWRRYADTVLRSLSLGIAVLDTDLKVRSWNRWNENAWGLRAEEVKGEALMNLDIGLPVRRLWPDLERVLAGEVPQAELDVQAFDRRGRSLRCRVRIAPLQDQTVVSRGVVITVEDVTEAGRDTEHAAYLGRVIGRSLNEVYFLDPATLRFLLVNRGAERKLGHPLARLRQMALTDMMPGVSEEGLRAAIEPLLRGARDEVVFEADMRSADGRMHPVEMCMQHFADEVPPLLVAIVHDTTERQRLHAAD